MAGFGKPQKHKKSIKQDASRSRTEEAIKQSITKYQQGDLEGAKISLEKTLQADHSNSFALGFLATIEKALGNNKRALKLFKRSTDISQNNSDILHNYSGLIKEQDPIKAITLSDQAVHISPENSRYLERNGYLKWQADDLDNALEATLKAISLNPSLVDAHMNLGGIYKDLGNLDQALASTLKSLDLKPDNPNAHMNLGEIYRNLGNFDKALASTLKSLDLKPDNHTAHMNLGGIYRDLGNLDQALASTLKSLDLKPDNPDAHMNLGGIYKDLGNRDQALAFLTKAMKSEKTKEKAAVKLAETYYYLGNYHEGVKAISNISSKKSVNLLLSLYLCLNRKVEFNRCAKDLISKGWLNPQGSAAIDHANILYGQMLDNGLDGTSLDSIFVQPINKQEFSDALIQEILIRLSTGSLQSRAQGHLVNGLQTSGNILDLPEKPFQALKELLVQKIDYYNQTCDINTDKNFRINWEKNLYRLRGWAIVMNKGGNLENHNHETGWLTGTFYLQMPEKGSNKEEGAIEFSHQGPRYPSGNAAFEKRLIRPSARDLNIFSSALFHRTHPFQSEKQRICVAFDISVRNDL